MARGKWLWVPSALLLACGGGDPRSKSDPGAGGGIRVVGGDVDEGGTVWLRFGTVAVGAASERSVVLHNVGTSEEWLSILEPRLPFLVSEAPVRLGAGQQGRVRFRLAPAEGGVFDEFAEIRFGLKVIRIRLLGEAPEPAPCELSAYPEELRFTAADDEPEYLREARVRITNQGEGICRVESVWIEGDSAFSTPILDPFELPPGSSMDVPVHFLSRAEAKGLLVLGMGEDELRVALGTKKENDCLQSEGDEAILEVLGLGCRSPRLVVENGCDEALTVDAFGSSGFVSGGNRRPWSLQAEGKAEFTIDYAPTSAPWEGWGDFIVQAENGDRILQKVFGRLERIHEVFHALPEETLDILFVLDVGESLAEFQDAIDAHGSYLARQMDFEWRREIRVHVTTTSMEEAGGCKGEAGRLVPLDGSRPRTVTWQTPNREQVLLENLRVPACSEGGGPGLSAIEAAVGEGWPWWRAGELHVYLFSVEDDTSPEEVEAYRDRFETFVGEGRRYLDRLELYIPTSNCRDLTPVTRYFGVLPAGIVSPICFAGALVPPVGATSFEVELAQPLVDLDQNGHIDELDGVELLVDGRAYLDYWYILDAQRLYIPGYGGAWPVMRGSRVEIRYPLSCR